LVDGFLKCLFAPSDGVFVVVTPTVGNFGVVVTPSDGDFEVITPADGGFGVCGSSSDDENLQCFGGVDDGAVFAVVAALAEARVEVVGLEVLLVFRPCGLW
jgi:ApbE superfamily uncharacterized protein (UPF0280 family)